VRRAADSANASVFSTEPAVAVTARIGAIATNRSGTDSAGLNAACQADVPITLMARIKAVSMDDMRQIAQGQVTNWLLAVMAQKCLNLTGVQILSQFKLILGVAGSQNQPVVGKRDLGHGVVERFQNDPSGAGNGLR